MSIRNRLIAIMVVAIVGFATVFFVATLGLEKLGDRISEIGEEKIPHVLIAEDIITESLAFQRDILRLILVQDVPRQERIQKRILDTRAHISQLNKELRAELVNKEALQLLEDMDQLRQIPIKFNNQIMELINNKQKDQAIEIVTSTEYTDGYDAYINKMKALVDLEKKQAKQASDEGEAEASSAKIWILIISGVVLLVLVIFFVFVIQSITQAVKQVVSAVSQVTQTATFNTRLPTRDDELNDISTNLNHLLAGLEKAITESNQVVSAIENADFTQRMNGNYVGDLEKLKQGVNGSANSVSFMMGELEKVMNGLNAGQFDVRMDQKVPQVFRTLVETALNSLSHVVTDISQVMTQMTAGHFDGRVTSNASGELLAMKNNINASMDAVAHAIRAISEVVSAQSQGDLTKTLPSATFKGQLQALTDAINSSANKVKQTVIQSVEASNVVNEAAALVSQGSTDLSGRVQEQAAALEETSATMNEMAAAVQANTANAQKVSELAHQVQHQAGAGVDVMQQTISAMQSIKESSAKIADIVTLIDGIAFQTNLLALNAAVEAARAGEHGRGFAVVAGEVRALAQKSAEAAKDIKELITDSVSRIEVGTQLADKSGEMLSGITGSIEQVASMIEQIANASSEQSQGINQVHKAMTDIDRVTQENAALVEETTAATSSLSREANHLKDNMAFFKTNQQ